MIFAHINFRSTIDAAAVSARSLAAYRKTEALVVVVRLPNGEFVFVPGEPTRQHLSTRDHEKALQKILAAVNASEPLCCADLPLTRELWRTMGLPEPETWAEFETLARIGGYPSDLDACSKILGLAPVDQALTKIVAQLKKFHGTYYAPVGKSALCHLQDESQRRIAVMAAIAGKTQHLYTPVKHQVFQIHHSINQTGIYVDKELAEKVLQIAAMAKEEREQRVRLESSGRVSGYDLRRLEVMQEILSEQGITLPDLKADTLERLLDRDDLPDLARSILEASLGHAKVAHRRLSRALAQLDADSKLRDIYKFHGAHTGRYSSVGVQLHNLPKPADNIVLTPGGKPQRIDYPALLDAAYKLSLDGLRAAVTTKNLNDAITALIRIVFKASPGKKFVILDWAAIEPRIWCWLAGDEEHLQMFRDQICLYCRLSQRLFNREIGPDDPERKPGKLAVLGGGYQMGSARFETYCTQFDLDLATVGLTAKKVIDGFRTEFSRLADRNCGLWALLQHRSMEALCQPQLIAGCLFQQVNSPVCDSGMLVTLPSGSYLSYPGACIEQCTPKWANDGRKLPTFVYRQPHSRSGSGNIMFGGKWLENITQSLGADILNNAMMQTAVAGLPPILHCHDEIGWEVEKNDATEALNVLTQTMEAAPDWAPGLPLKAKGFTADRYYKEAPAKME